jgi:small-conductance mechanosensitive channel
VSGLILLVEHPIRVGDIVEVGQITGEVMRIGTRSTWITRGNNSVAILPNSDLVTGRVINWMAIDTRARLTVEVSVAYSADPETVQRLLIDVAHEHPQVHRQPAPVVALGQLTESGMRFELHYWISRQVGVMSEVAATSTSRFSSRSGRTGSRWRPRAGKCGWTGRRPTGPVRRTARADPGR